MIHLACYQGTVTALANNVDIPAVNDQSLTISNGHYVLTEPARLAGAYSQGTSLTRTRINTPTLRATSLPYMTPINRAVLPGNLPPMAILGDYALPLTPIDEIAFETSNNLASSTEVHTIGAWFAFGMRPIPNGAAYTLRATSTFTAVANKWTAGAFVLDQVLPAGRYSVIGVSVVSATAVFCRLIFPAQTYRPGTLGCADEGENNFGYVRMGSMGELGQFDSIAQPQLEVFCTSADTEQTVFMDCIRVR